jgi:putative ABC transport system permease protein
MMNAMLMSVFERMHEFGVLRALGWRRRRLVGMVVVEAIALSLLSAVAGIGIGVGLGELLRLEPTMGQWLIPTYSAELFVRVGILVLVLGVIGSVYPALRAASMRPVEALRYE